MAADPVLEGLKAGILRFQAQQYPPMRETYLHAASTPQEPKTLFIACADSRVDPETITSSGPGELFTTRNIGNMVPAYGEMPGGVSAAIEYAVSALKVQHVVVCGHTDCGAMKALLNPAAVEQMPAVRSWLSHAVAAPSGTAGGGDSPEGDGEGARKRLERLTEENVLHQMRQLRTHPSVAEAMARGELSVSGWVYDIGTGEIRIAEDGQTAFRAVGE